MTFLLKNKTKEEKLLQIFLRPIKILTLFQLQQTFSVDEQLWWHLNEEIVARNTELQKHSRWLTIQEALLTAALTHWEGEDNGKDREKHYMEKPDKNYPFKSEFSWRFHKESQVYRLKFSFST